MKDRTVANSLLIRDTPSKFKKTAATAKSNTKQTLTAVMEFFFFCSKWFWMYQNHTAIIFLCK